jgi:hypothetical protein
MASAFGPPGITRPNPHVGHAGFELDLKVDLNTTSDIDVLRSSS